MNFKHAYFALAFLVVLGLTFAGAPYVLAQGNAQTAVCAETYTVVAGDTLGSIALKFLGSNGLYQQIADATNAAAKTDPSFATISDPNVIEVGWKLCIPAKSATAPTQPTSAGAAAGLYTQTGPAADASYLVFLLTLDPNGGMVRTMSYLGKENFSAKGTWKQTGSTVTITFTEDAGKPSTSVVVFKVEGDKLITTQDDSKEFGNVGFTLTKTPADVVNLAGVYNVTLTAADSTERFIGLTLPPDGTVLWIENVTGKDSVQKTGTWQAAGTKATVNLTKQGGQAIQESFVLELQGTKLVATEFNKEAWPNGLTLNRVQNIGATTATAPVTAPAPQPAPAVAPLTLAQLGNATFNVQDAPGGKVTLKDGKAEMEITPGSASKYTAQLAEPVANGALNAKPYAAAVLITSSGGSGSFYNLAVAPNDNGKPGVGLTTLLGDRIKVQTIAFENNVVKVNYLDRKPEESFATEPSVPVTKTFTVNAAGALVEGQPGAATSNLGTGTGFVGTFLASAPAADASALLKTLLLAQDGTATLNNNYVGKGVVVETGTWAQTSENTADVTFTKMDDRNIQDALTFQLTNNTLTAIKWDQSIYGENPPTFERATANVTGTVTYVQKISVPDNTVVEVYLVDASKSDAPYTYLSGASFTSHGSQAPFAYAVPYAGAQINPSGNYLLIAFISADGKLLFKNSNGVKVLTGGAPSANVEIVVEPPAP
ncbi:MAG: YbaY family lipoprotein [Chloroflexi bacterium]|nr:YbaY family lipoprotein [Chloroflexota bacterium]